MMSEFENERSDVEVPGPLTRVRWRSGPPDPTTAAWAASTVSWAAVSLYLDAQDYAYALAHRLGHAGHTDPLVWWPGLPWWLNAPHVFLECAFMVLSIVAIISGVAILHGSHAALNAMIICAWSTIGILLLRIVVAPFIDYQFLARCHVYFLSSARAAGDSYHWSNGLLNAMRESIFAHQGALLIGTTIEIGYCALLLRGLKSGRTASSSG
ncbi:MAG TPA: hypothetical protein VFJ58_16530 [Armatimonadota bacterium]|nr:hypothetical protein [Armatimonadota bacterium]